MLVACHGASKTYKLTTLITKTPIKLTYQRNIHARIISRETNICLDLGSTSNVIRHGLHTHQKRNRTAEKHQKRPPKSNCHRAWKVFIGKVDLRTASFQTYLREQTWKEGKLWIIRDIKPKVKGSCGRKKLNCLVDLRFGSSVFPLIWLSLN